MESNAELVMTLREFREALRVASANLTVDRFCAALGNDIDAYGRDKFAAFQELGRLLAAFSTPTLERLILAERERHP